MKKKNETKKGAGNKADQPRWLFEEDSIYEALLVMFFDPAGYMQNFLSESAKEGIRKFLNFIQLDEKFSNYPYADAVEKLYTNEPYSGVSGYQKRLYMSVGALHNQRHAWSRMLREILAMLVK